MATSLTSNKIQVDSADSITLNDGTATGHIIHGTGGLGLGNGTTAERPTMTSPYTNWAGTVRYNYELGGLEMYIPDTATTTWKVVGALDGSSSAFAAPDAEYLKTVAGITTDGTYWLSISGSPAEYYCDMSTDGGGWILFTSCPNSGNWLSIDTGPQAGWEHTSTAINFNYGTYSKTGAIGSYWKSYYNWGVTDVLFKTGNNTYWLAFPLSYIQGSSSYVTFTANVRTSNNFPDQTYNANNAVSVMHRPSNGEDPWIQAANIHVGGNTAQDYNFWGENDSTGHINFKNAQGGIRGFVR
jgi:hypothetical protein